MAHTDVQLKLLIDSKARVLFAEADKNFIDFLFNLLSLPLGTVISLLEKQNMVGCLANLYESVENLNDTYLQPNQSKDDLLMPRVSFSSGLPMLLPNIESSTAVKLYICPNALNYGNCDGYGDFDDYDSFGNCNGYGNCHSYGTDDPKVFCPAGCGKQMNNQITYVKPPAASKSASTVATTAGFVKGVVTYLVMDDLSVKPMSSISSIILLNKFNIKEVGALEEKLVTLDVNDGLKVLEASLHSKTVLTDVFLKKVTM